MLKLIFSVCLLAATLAGCLSSPVEFPFIGAKREITNLTDTINAILEVVTAGMEEIIILSEHNEIHIVYSNVFNITLIEDNVTLEGLKAIRCKNCTAVVNAEDANKDDLDFTFTLPILKLLAEHYSMSGMVVDTIHLHGDGTMSLIPEEVDIRLWGTATTDFTFIPPSFTATFDTVTLDIEMWRWTVDFQGLMPGSDLGTVFNEFFTMIGPELIDLWEIKLNEGDRLLDFINGIFGGGGTSSLSSLLKKN